MKLTDDFTTYDRRQNCMPDCGCPPVLKTFRKGARLKHVLFCRSCNRWGDKAVPHRYVEETPS